VGGGGGGGGLCGQVRGGWGPREKRIVGTTLAFKKGKLREKTLSFNGFHGKKGPLLGGPPLAHRKRKLCGSSDQSLRGRSALGGRGDLNNRDRKH